MTRRPSEIARDYAAQPQRQCSGGGPTPPTPTTTLPDNDETVLLGDGEDPDTVLERLLSSLSQLPNLSRRVTDRHLHGEVSVVSCILSGQPYDSSSLFDRDKTSTGSSSSSSSSDDDDDWEWEQGLLLARQLVVQLLQLWSPLELHATASTGLVFGNDDNNNNNQHCHHTHTTFRITCLLLCSMALQACPSVIVRRRKRHVTLLLETIRLFQHYGGDGDGDGDDDRGLSSAAAPVPSVAILHAEDRTDCATRSSHTVWCSHILPALSHVHQALHAQPTTVHPHIPTDMVPWNMALEAGAVACTTRLAAGTIGDRSTLEGLYTALDDTVVHGRIDLVYRRHGPPSWKIPGMCDDDKEEDDPSSRESSSSASDHRDARDMAYYTACRDVDEEERAARRERCMGMDTTWSDVGLARLATCAAQKVRPGAWTNEAFWRLFFPHVQHLLFSEATNDDRERESDHCLNRSLGVGLLQLLFKNTDIRSLSLPRPDSPDHPIGTIQLLTNHMIALSARESSLSTTAFQFSSAPATTSGDPAKELRSSQVFVLIKQLLNVYHPTDQVNCVIELLHTCPHSGLKPKLVDTLRSFVSWKDEAAERLVWHAVVEDLSLRVLETTHCNNESSGISNMTDLIDHAELHIAAIGLVHLWLLMKQKVPSELFHLCSRLERIDKALEATVPTPGSSKPQPLDLTTTTQSSTRELHRLDLLKSIVEQTLEALRDCHLQ